MIVHGGHLRLLDFCGVWGLRLFMCYDKLRITVVLNKKKFLGVAERTLGSTENCFFVK